MKVYSIKKDNSPSFNAKLQLKGNTNLINNEGVETLKKIVSKIGSKTDVIEISIPQTVNIDITGHVNGIREHFTQSIELTTLLEGLVASLEKAKEIFQKQRPTVNKTSEKQKTAGVAKLSNQITADNTKNDKIGFLIPEKDAWEVFDEVAIDTEYAKNLREAYRLAKEQGINYCFTEDKESMLHLVASSSRTDLMKKLLSHPDINVNIKDIELNTPLHIAAENEQVEQLKLLLARDDVDEAALNDFNEYYHDLLDGEALKFYKKYKKNLYTKFWLDNESTPKRTINIKTSEDVEVRYPDFFISEKDAWEVFDEVASGIGMATEYKERYHLVKKFGNGYTFTKNGESMLHLVAMSERTDLMKKLLSDPVIDVNVENNRGQTPLYLAAKCDMVEQAKLLAQNADTELYTADDAGVPIDDVAGEKVLELINSGELRSLNTEAYRKKYHS